MCIAECRCKSYVETMREYTRTTYTVRPSKVSEPDLDLERAYAEKATAMVAPIKETCCRVCGGRQCYIAPHIPSRNFRAGEFDDSDTPGWWQGEASMRANYRPEVEGYERARGNFTANQLSQERVNRESFERAYRAYRRSQAGGPTQTQEMYRLVLKKDALSSMEYYAGVDFNTVATVEVKKQVWCESTLEWRDC